MVDSTNSSENHEKRVRIVEETDGYRVVVVDGGRETERLFVLREHADNWAAGQRLRLSSVGEAT